MPDELYEFGVVDSKGRIVIPAAIRKALNIADGMKMIIIADSTKREIRIIPLADKSAKVYRLKITMDDSPGVLAQTASILAREGVDLLMTESRTIRRGLSAEWNIIADLSRCRVDVRELINIIKKLEFIKEIEVSEITVS